MNINKQINNLEGIRREGADKVFTMYLNTDPSDPDQQGGKWKIHFKNGLRNFKHYLDEDDNKDELKNFQVLKKKVEEFVYENEPNLQKGIVIFATADEEIWYADLVQMRVKTEFFWQERPELEQLMHLQSRFPKAGIILVQQNEIKIIESHLNEIEDTALYELDMNIEDWREKLGPRKASGGMHPGATNFQKDNFLARFEANQHRWYKSIAPKLDKRAKDREWEKIYIVGESDASHELQEQMNKPVDKVINKNMLDHNESKVLTEVLG